MINYKKVVDLLNNHKIVIFPTETVYGMAIYYDDEIAYNNLINLKKRSFDKPISIMVRSSFNLDDYFIISDKARRIINKFLPGPLTIILKLKTSFPYQSHLGIGNVGIRIPKDKKLQKLLNKVNKPLQVTSCNISNNKPCCSYKEANNLFGTNNEVGMIIKGKSKSNIPTTVVDLTTQDIKILREGEITKEMIMEVIK